MINVNLPGLFSGGISPTNTSGSTGYFSNTRQADEFLVLVAESFFPTMAVLVRKVLRISRMCGVLTILSTAVGCSALRVSDWTLRKLAEPGWLPPAAFSNKLFCDCVAKYNCYDVRGGSNSSRRGMEESAMWVAKRLCITSDVFAVGGGAENLMEQCPVGVLELLKTRAGTSGVRVNYMS
ncbi:hypothetical protein Pelo_9379 [Pelomyxa schiedti]|nr:hypothetical protein Pelo_9379 [Pelomyxa schiedti]